MSTPQLSIVELLRDDLQLLNVWYNLECFILGASNQRKYMHHIICAYCILGVALDKGSVAMINHLLSQGGSLLVLHIFY